MLGYINTRSQTYNALHWAIHNGWRLNIDRTWSPETLSPYRLVLSWPWLPRMACSRTNLVSWKAKMCYYAPDSAEVGLTWRDIYWMGKSTIVSSLSLNGPSNENRFKWIMSTSGNFANVSCLDAARNVLHFGQCLERDIIRSPCASLFKHARIIPCIVFLQDLLSNKVIKTLL